jgi:hypothetical protein
VILDMAMSVVARGKIREAMKRGKQIPETWATDRDRTPDLGSEGRTRRIPPSDRRLQGIRARARVTSSPGCSPAARSSTR